MPKGLLEGLPSTSDRASGLGHVGSAIAHSASTSFKVGRDNADWPTGETPRLILDILAKTSAIAMSKGRYEPLVAEYMIAELGIEAAPSSKSALAGMIPVSKQLTPYAFMRDAEVPRYVIRGPLRAGFAGFHQLYGARAAGDVPRLSDVPVIRHPTARFVLAAGPHNMDALIQRLENGETLTLTTEYVALARRLASELGWSVNLYQSGKGMAEIDAAHHPDRFDGVVAIADTGKTLDASGLSIIEGFDRLAPVDVHFVWNPDIPVGDANLQPETVGGERAAGLSEDPARQARLNRWLDGRHAPRVKEMVATSHRQGHAEHLPDRV